MSAGSAGNGRDRGAVSEGDHGFGARGRLWALLVDPHGQLAALAGAQPSANGALGAEGPACRPARIACAGPRAERHPEEYELLVEAIYEGYLLHYGSPRIVRPPEDDLGLLAGDRLYAIGLARLVALGDTSAVAELADTITLSALAHGAGDPELAAAVWEAGARAVGWGPSPPHARAKRMVAVGDPRGLDAMRTSAAPLPASR